MRTWLLIAISAFLAVLVGQAPEFAQQYARRLGGAIEELQRIVDHFDDDSRRSGYDRQGALALTGRNSEQLVRDQGTRMSETIDRLANLRAQQVALNQRGAFARVTALATRVDREIAARTWRISSSRCRSRWMRSCSLCSASSRRWRSRRQPPSGSDGFTKPDCHRKRRSRGVFHRFHRPAVRGPSGASGASRSAFRRDGRRQVDLPMAPAEVQGRIRGALLRRSPLMSNMTGSPSNLITKSTMGATSLSTRPSTPLARSAFTNRANTSDILRRVYLVDSTAAGLSLKRIGQA
jgi:hypothetical protein